MSSDHESSHGLRRHAPVTSQPCLRKIKVPIPCTLRSDAPLPTDRSLSILDVSITPTRHRSTAPLGYDTIDHEVEEIAQDDATHVAKDIWWENARANLVAELGDL